MKKMTSALVAGLLAVGGAQAATITNGSFENNTGTAFSYEGVPAGASTIAGWTVSEGGVDLKNNYWFASEGDYSLDLSYLSAGMVSTMITDLVVGQTYVISFDMAGNTDGGNVVKQLEAMVGGVSQIFSFDTTGKSRINMGWMTMSLVFTATAATETLSFLSLESNPYGPALDNVSIASIPVPGAVLLMGSGLIAGGIARRRAKRA
ncbi:choice-of-anchor C family protein [Parvularcula sp. LCG005]|uniref:choice-of-anchor C family protein n=1 Tax=Parvularcula sp. LCG005 TaxID=3078805 RepID=UPI002943AAD9|nr:choice-of-anchor C family protein [Parvularcula sp. LCG005]WOI52795.1 choice-of-anchor C family protein [Parvularcula sp. LCG005]